MTLSELGNLGEAISGFAVVVSLLYVAYELRTNTRTLRATSAAQGQDSLAGFNEVLATHPGLTETWARVAERGTLADLPPGEALRARILLRALVQRYESMYFRYEAGLLEERVWAVWRHWLAGFLRTPAAAEWWNAERHSSLYTPDFIADLASAPGASLDPVGSATRDQ